jgi:hypothetical protein
MKAKFGAIVVAGSGKLGGHVASRNRAGAYFRTKVTPVNPNTSSQANVRTRLTTFSQAWRALTEVQRAAWNAAVQDYARTDIFGDIKNPSGFNLFQRINNNLAQIGVAQINVPLAPDDVVGPVTLTLAGDESASTLILTYTVTPVTAGMAWIVRATPGMSAGKYFVKSEYRILTVIAAATASPAALGVLWEAMFGELTAGEKIFVSVEPVNIATGQKGIARSVSTVVVA